MENKRHVNFKNRTGEKFITKEGYEVEIIDYSNKSECTITFNDDKKTTVKNSKFCDIKKGNIKNPNHKSVCSIGYLGQGNFKPNEYKKPKKSYTAWTNLLHRCYDKRQPSYKDVTVCEEWHNYQHFTQWYEDNYKEYMINGWDLDKDILCKECKIYSPETCVFVPQEINKLFTKSNTIRGKYPIGVNYDKRNKKFVTQLNNGNKNQTHIGYFNTIEEAFQAYKTAKEAYIKEVADKWRHLITEQTYQALINYNIEITD